MASIGGQVQHENVDLIEPESFQTLACTEGRDSSAAKFSGWTFVVRQSSERGMFAAASADPTSASIRKKKGGGGGGGRGFHGGAQLGAFERERAEGALKGFLEINVLHDQSAPTPLPSPATWPPYFLAGTPNAITRSLQVFLFRMQKTIDIPACLRRFMAHRNHRPLTH